MKILTKQEYLLDDAITQSVLLRECHNGSKAYVMALQHGTNLYVHKEGAATGHGVSVTDLRKDMVAELIPRIDAEPEKASPNAKEMLFDHMEYMYGHFHTFIVRLDNEHELDALKQLTDNRFLCIAVVNY